MGSSVRFWRFAHAAGGFAVPSQCELALLLFFSIEPGAGPAAEHSGSKAFLSRSRGDQGVFARLWVAGSTVAHRFFQTFQGITQQDSVVALVNSRALGL